MTRYAGLADGPSWCPALADVSTSPAGKWPAAWPRARADGRVPQRLHQFLVFTVRAFAIRLGGLHAVVPAGAGNSRLCTKATRHLPVPCAGLMLPCRGAYFSVRERCHFRRRRPIFVGPSRREHGVAAIPVSAFYKGRDDFGVIRFCFAKSATTLQRRWAAGQTVSLASPWVRGGTARRFRLKRHGAQYHAPDASVQALPADFIAHPRSDHRGAQRRQNRQRMGLCVARGSSR